jgi:leader peptidase (prepilin peptidase)/N-methyltransferase
VILVGLGALVDSPAAGLRAVVAGVVLAAVYAVLALIGSGMGGGDVKLAPTVGMILGYLGWEFVLIGSLATFLLAALWGLALVVTRRATRKTHIAFGPFMVIGTLVTAWVAALTT